MWDNWKLMHIGLTMGWAGGELASLLEALQMQIFSLDIQFLQENTTQLLTWEDICLVPYMSSSRIVRATWTGAGGLWCGGFHSTGK